MEFLTEEEFADAWDWFRPGVDILESRARKKINCKDRDGSTRRGVAFDASVIARHN